MQHGRISRGHGPLLLRIWRPLVLLMVMQLHLLMVVEVVSSAVPICGCHVFRPMPVKHLGFNNVVVSTSFSADSQILVISPRDAETDWRTPWNHLLIGSGYLCREIQDWLATWTLRRRHACAAFQSATAATASFGPIFDAAAAQTFELLRNNFLRKQLMQTVIGLQLQYVFLLLQKTISHVFTILLACLLACFGESCRLPNDHKHLQIEYWLRWPYVNSIWKQSMLRKSQQRTCFVQERWGIQWAIYFYDAFYILLDSFQQGPNKQPSAGGRPKDFRSTSRFKILDIVVEEESNQR